MKLWYQSLARQTEATPYGEILRATIAAAVDPGTTVDMRGVSQSAGIGVHYRFLEHHDMREVMFKDLFDEYFISAEMGVQKPDTQFFEKALAKLRESDPDLKPEDLIFIDDTQSHIDGAAALGIDARLYTSIDQIKSLL